MGLVVLRPGTTDRLIDVAGFWGRLLGIDYPIVPQAAFGWDPVHSLWIPNVVSPSGTTIEFHAQAILSALTNLLSEMSGEVMSTDAVRGELTKLTRTGSVLRTQQVMPPRQGTETGQPATAIGLGQGEQIVHDIGRLAFDSHRKYLGVDAGQYTSPVAVDGTQITFTGQNLTEVVGGVTRFRSSLIYNVMDRMYHTITAIVDPAGGVVGTITVTPPIPSANATFRIPFTSTPHAWNSATDALQTLAVAAPPKGVNGPAVLLSSAALAEVAGTYNLDVPVANYDLLTVQIFWDAAAGDTYQWDLLARIDDQAAGDWVNINAWFNVAGTALGAPADPGLNICRIIVRTQLRELRVQRTKANNNGNAVVRVWIMAGR